jgi:hypothetical protein
MRHAYQIVSALRLSVLFLGLVIFSGETYAQQRPERPTGAGAPPTQGVVDAEKPPEVEIWTDKGRSDDTSMPTYYVGERIYISFRVNNKDCYITIYDIDSTGNVNILFPNPYHRDNLVRKGRVYTIPTSNYKYDLVVKGPTGEEILLVVASSYGYYHWQYGTFPPPIWSDKWGTPSTWGHSGGADYSIASRRFQQRLQLPDENLADRTVLYIQHYIEEIVTPPYPVTADTMCKFYVTIPPY